MSGDLSDYYWNDKPQCEVCTKRDTCQNKTIAYKNNFKICPEFENERDIAGKREDFVKICPHCGGELI